MIQGNSMIKKYLVGLAALVTAGTSVQLPTMAVGVFLQAIEEQLAG